MTKGSTPETSTEPARTEGNSQEITKPRSHANATERILRTAYPLRPHDVISLITLKPNKVKYTKSQGPPSFLFYDLVISAPASGHRGAREWEAVADVGKECVVVREHESGATSSAALALDVVRPQLVGREMEEPVGVRGTHRLRKKEVRYIHVLR